MRLLIVVLLAPLLSLAADRVDPSGLDGKVLLGYQGWFTCPDDDTGRWTHWSRGVPTAETLTVEMFPDLSELDGNEKCVIPGMSLAGGPAYLFSSRNPKTVMRHFEWMRQYGLDGVLVQRFVGEIARKQREGDIVLRNVMAAAAATGRTFAIEYDVSGANPDTFAQMIEDDWKYLVDTVGVARAANYQRHNGKPVVSVWGMGLSDGPGHPPDDPAVAMQLIRWFQAGAEEQYRATYMGGTPAHWGTLSADSRSDPAWSEVYGAMDVLQPWNVGRYGGLAGADRWRDEILASDLKTTAQTGQLYLPVIFPGFSWSNLKKGAKPNQIPRLSGEFLWRQAYNAKVAGARALKIAMFDEVDEGTAIFKVAPRRDQVPDQGFWLTLDADGEELPNDWYLRIAGEITKMFHGEREATAALPLSVSGR